MSSKSLAIAALAAAVTSIGTAGTAAAQTPPLDSVGERFESGQRWRPSTVDGLEALVTGYEDLILLERRRFFTAWGSVTPEFTSNAALSSDGEEDWLAVAHAGVRAATRLADTVDVYAELGVMSAWYQDFDELDYSAVQARIGASRAFTTSFGQWTAEFSYAPAVIYGSGFSDRQQTRHQLLGLLQLYKQLPVPAGTLALVPTLTVEQVYTNPAPYAYRGAALDVALLYQPRPQWHLGASVGGFVRDYSDYFEGIVGRSRRDDGYRAALFARWMPLARVSLSLGADLADNGSTSDVNDYDVTSGSLGATFNVRF